MNDALRKMIERYHATDSASTVQALREIDIKHSMEVVKPCNI